MDIKIKNQIIEIKNCNNFVKEELKKQLNITPGSVSIFNLIYAKNVRLLLSKEVWSAEKIGAHPNDNDATLEINHFNLEKYLGAIGIRAEVFEIE